MLDGNVIRLLCRYRGWSLPWWESGMRRQLQTEVDRWVVKGSDPSPPHPAKRRSSNTNRCFADIRDSDLSFSPAKSRSPQARVLMDGPSSQRKQSPPPVCPSLINQALMELGALVCTPQNPTCLLCPLQAGCGALKKGLVSRLPLKKRDKAKQLWLWEPVLFLQGQKNKKMALITDHRLPVLKNYPVFPGRIVKLSRPPGKYDFLHSITCHVLYVRPCKKTFKAPPPKEKHSLYPSLKWMAFSEIKKQNPSSLIQKVLKRLVVGIGRPLPSGKV